MDGRNWMFIAMNVVWILLNIRAMMGWVSADRAHLKTLTDSNKQIQKLMKCCDRLEDEIAELTGEQP